MQLAFTSNFNPRSPHGERQRYSDYGTQYGLFQSTLPARGATQRGRCAWLGCDDFNPRSPHGERHVGIVHPPLGRRHFNPRSPHGERRSSCSFSSISLIFQSTLPARGATKTTGHSKEFLNISIHAPRTGSDRKSTTSSSAGRKFQSTLPARGATPPSCKEARHLAFQSTLPARGATAKRSFALCAAAYFNPRSPHGERHGRKLVIQARLIISIHAPRTGSDPQQSASHRPQCDFNPRSPHGERPLLLLA